MFITISKNEFNTKYIFFSNEINQNNQFIKLNYSNELFIMNSIYIHIDLFFFKIEKQLNKLLFFYNIKNNLDKIHSLINIEKNILYFVKNNISWLNNKNIKPIYNLLQTLQNSFIKIITKNEKQTQTHTQSQKYNIILKISGIWIKDNNYGLVFKFI